jgi:hypothetical protein
MAILTLIVVIVAIVSRPKLELSFAAYRDQPASWTFCSVCA